MNASEASRAPLWLRVLAAAVLLLLGAGTAYAVTIGILEFANIGV